MDPSIHPTIDLRIKINWCLWAWKIKSKSNRGIDRYYRLVIHGQAGLVERKKIFARERERERPLTWERLMMLSMKIVSPNIPDIYPVFSYFFHLARFVPPNSCCFSCSLKISFSVISKKNNNNRNDSLIVIIIVFGS